MTEMKSMAYILQEATSKRFDLCRLDPAHLTAVLKSAIPGSLIVVDELCRSTESAEGLGISKLSHF